MNEFKVTIHKIKGIQHGIFESNLDNDLYADLMCNLKNDFVKGFNSCENFECFRLEDD